MKCRPYFISMVSIRLLQLLEDDEEEDLLFFLLHAAAKKRRVKWKHKRINWENHLKKIRHIRGFQSRYHMTEPSFNKLVSILRADLQVNELQSVRSSGTGLITPEMIVAAGLRFLGGSLTKDIADIFGMSNTTARNKIYSFLHALDNHLKLNVPMTKEELAKSAAEWSKISSAFGIYDGCIGAIDGWLCCINTPSVHNPTDYHSGHYHRHGINIQAVCDANLRFLYFAVAAPGRTNDARAFNRCLQLRHWLDSLPEKYFILGDNAYTLNKMMLIPFSGAAKHITYNRSFNFYLSQLRIRVEMAFGRLTTKWRIFRRNLDQEVDNISLICRVAAKLHNFVIDNDNIRFSASAEEPADFEVDTLANGPIFNKGYLRTLPTREQSGLIQNCDRRNAILSEIETRMMIRPERNLARNNELDAESDYEND